MQSAAGTRETPAEGPVLLRHIRAAAARRAPAADAACARTPPLRTPERIIAGAIGRAAERLHGMALFFDRIEFGEAGLAELAELFPDQPLISVVEGPAEALGVVAICPGLLSAVIETQAMGRISSRPAPARRPTRTDGAICADFINACLVELGDELAARPGCGGLRGYRYASFLDDPRPLELMLDDMVFHLVSIRLRAGEAAQRDGRIVMALPVARAAASRPAAIAAALPEPLPPQPDRTAGTGSLAQAVRSVPIDLVGVLCRRMISLGELRALSPGDVIALPPDILGAATLETTTGQTLFRGKLGEVAGRHALRLVSGRPGQAVAAGAETPRPDSGDEDHTGGPDGAIHEPPLADLGGPDAFREPEQAGMTLAG